VDLESRGSASSLSSHRGQKLGQAPTPTPQQPSASPRLPVPPHQRSAASRPRSVEPPNAPACRPAAWRLGRRLSLRYI
jgi:hypothetical protein